MLASFPGTRLLATTMLWYQPMKLATVKACLSIASCLARPLRVKLVVLIKPFDKAL